MSDQQENKEEAKAQVQGNIQNELTILQKLVKALPVLRYLYFVLFVTILLGIGIRLGINVSTLKSILPSMLGMLILVFLAEFLIKNVNVPIIKYTLLFVLAFGILFIPVSFVSYLFTCKPWIKVYAAVADCNHGGVPEKKNNTNITPRNENAMQTSRILYHDTLDMNSPDLRNGNLIFHYEEHNLRPNADIEVILRLRAQSECNSSWVLQPMVISNFLFPRVTHVDQLLFSKSSDGNVLDADPVKFSSLKSDEHGNFNFQLQNWADYGCKTNFSVLYLPGTSIIIQYK